MVEGRRPGRDVLHQGHRRGEPERQPGRVPQAPGADREEAGLPRRLRRGPAHGLGHRGRHRLRDEDRGHLPVPPREYHVRHRGSRVPIRGPHPPERAAGQGVQPGLQQELPPGGQREVQRLHAGDADLRHGPGPLPARGDPLEPAPRQPEGAREEEDDRPRPLLPGHGRLLGGQECGGDEEGLLEGLLPGVREGLPELRGRRMGHRGRGLRQDVAHGAGRAPEGGRSLAGAARVHGRAREQGPSNVGGLAHAGSQVGGPAAGGGVLIGAPWVSQ
mmetsp:Transcript_35795/g.106290  ORF Transcript_35795/g.106290 Transcript_35795/m.106290 type:complete len:274 (+) Transcript_35795:2605-3426(+)